MLVSLLNMRNFFTINCTSLVSHILSSTEALKIVIPLPPSPSTDATSVGPGLTLKRGCWWPEQPNDKKLDDARL